MNKTKLIAIALAALTALSVSACAKSDENKDKAESAATAAESSTIGETTQSGESDQSGAKEWDGFSFSEGIGENGYFTDLRALDYVTLPDYKAINVPASEVEPDESAVEDELSSILSSYETQKQITDRAVADGDTVNIDYVGSVDGVEFDGGSTGGAGTDVTIGVTSYIDDFLEQLIGHMPGETINVEVTFPDPYQNEDLAGKDALFVTTINYIVETEIPELTDEFVAEKLSADHGWNNVAEAREGVAAQLREQNLTNYVREWILKEAEISEVPESLINYERLTMLSYYDTQYAAYGMKLEDAISQQGMESIDEFVESQKESIEAAAKTVLVLQAVAEDAGITADENEMRSFLAENMDDSSEDTLNEVIEFYGAPYLTQAAINEKTYELLATGAVIVDDGAADKASETD